MAWTNVLFDLDGTLTDPHTGITNCVRYAMEKLGCPLPENTDLNWVIGPPLLASLAKLLEDDDPAKAQECLRLYRERFSTIGLFENEVYPGVQLMLDELKSAGHRLFVATSKPTVYADQILDRFELSYAFERVYGSELDGTRTNKGELIGYLLESESLDSAKTVMIGDRHHDIVGARLNEVASIGVLYGYGTREELELAQPNGLAELPLDVAREVRHLRVP